MNQETGVTITPVPTLTNISTQYVYMNIGIHIYEYMVQFKQDQKKRHNYN